MGGRCPGSTWRATDVPETLGAELTHQMQWLRSGPGSSMAWSAPKTKGGHRGEGSIHPSIIDQGATQDPFQISIEKFEINESSAWKKEKFNPKQGSPGWEPKLLGPRRSPFNGWKGRNDFALNKPLGFQRTRDANQWMPSIQSELNINISCNHWDH